MVADPAQVSAQALDQWVKDLDNYVISDAFSSLASRTPAAPAKMKKWMRSSDEWIGNAGWSFVTHAALRDDSMPNAFFEGCLESIEAKIHKSRNRVRYSMNGALIAIGMRDSPHAGSLIESHRRCQVEGVHVQHPHTACIFTDLEPAIQFDVLETLETAARRPGDFELDDRFGIPQADVLP